MNRHARIIAGTLFLLLAFAAITLIRINPNASTPTRSNQSRQAGVTIGLVKGLLFTQEFTAAKDYMRGVDIICTHSGRKNTNENTLLLLDAGFSTLYKTTFNSSILKEGDLTPILFEHTVFVGKGKPAYLCLYSNDGTKDNAIHLLFNPADSTGPFYASRAIENDMEASLKNKIGQYKGSLMMRTFETGSSQFWQMKFLLYFLAVILAIIIIWFPQFRSALTATRIRPEWAFVVIALPFSLLFAFLTPPLQVPDESLHYDRIWEITEFHILKSPGTVPASIPRLYENFVHLRQANGQKTSAAEIRKSLEIKAEPVNRVAYTPPSNTLTYLPQALGVMAGKPFTSSIATLMYLGRISNLLISILILFFAIRIMPGFKWIFLILALMPKTLFLFGSLSYDSLTISLSFLAMAVFFHYAFACERQITLKDLGLMALIAVLLLLCKPPSFLLALLFFFIPPRKFGRIYKYIMIGVGVVALAVILLKVVPVASRYMSEPGVTAEASLPPSAESEEQELIRPDEQIRIILNDIPGYMKLIANSGLILYRSYILESFVGLLGFIDVELPDMLTYSYLLVILLTALLFWNETVRLGPCKKGLLLMIFILGYIIIETAMYVYATKPGRDSVFGVQGRYFIPMAPLFFMLFYNKYLNPTLNILVSGRRKEYLMAKSKLQPAIRQEILSKEYFFDRMFSLALIAFCTFTLLYSIYVTLIRYYDI